MVSKNEEMAAEREAAKQKIYRVRGPRGEAEIVMERLALGAVIVRCRSQRQPMGHEKDFTSHANALEYITQHIRDLIMEGDI